MPDLNYKLPGHEGASLRSLISGRTVLIAETPHSRPGIPEQANQVASSNKCSGICHFCVLILCRQIYETLRGPPMTYHMCQCMLIS